MNQTTEITQSRADAPAVQAQPRARTVAFVPRVDVREAADAFHVVADLPGADPASVDVTVEKNVLTISASTARSLPEGLRRLYGRGPAAREYRRAFSLGEKVDREGIQASYRSGTLRLVVPKAREALPRKIAVAAA